MPSSLSQKYLLSKIQNIMYKDDVETDSKAMVTHQQERASSFYNFDYLRPCWINSLQKTTINLEHNAKSKSLKILENKHKQPLSEVHKSSRKMESSYTSKDICKVFTLN